MSNVLLNDCSPEVTQQLSGLFGDEVTITSEPFHKDQDIRSYALVILFENSDITETLEKIKAIRFSAQFRNIPLVLVKPEDGNTSDQPYRMSGVTDVLSLSEPPEAFRQILQGYITPGRQPLKAEMAYIKPFVESTKDVLSTMADMDVEFKKVYFKNDMRMLGDVSGVISLTGNAEGKVIITFYWELAQKIISNIMEVKPDEINPELIHDGVGEIINMISGSAKKYLTDTPYQFQLSLPTIVVGWRHEIGQPDASNNIAVLLFDVDNSSFAVQVLLSPRPQPDETMQASSQE